VEGIEPDGQFGHLDSAFGLPHQTPCDGGVGQGAGVIRIDPLGLVEMISRPGEIPRVQGNDAEYAMDVMILVVQLQGLHGIAQGLVLEIPPRHPA